MLDMTLIGITPTRRPVPQRITVNLHLPLITYAAGGLRQIGGSWRGTVKLVSVNIAGRVNGVPLQVRSKLANKVIGCSLGCGYCPISDDLVFVSSNIARQKALMSGQRSAC
jgi:hypothetical protein